MSTISAYDVANVFVKLNDEDSGDVMTNLKLQKLVYYTQGFHVALTGSPLFKEDLVAWEHGPVVPELYQKLRQFKSGPVTIDEPVSENITGYQKGLIEEINTVYGQFSAWKLRDMTHNELPWKTTERNNIISADKLASYFKTQLA